ncbi:hypothetical protein [Arsenicicoccus dermatophilus]|uniref:hypothetical protein n=1 Tax=Arsenicicoccus dermatophilus TaxID=1076331 RepID=UPI0039175F49
MGPQDDERRRREQRRALERSRRGHPVGRELPGGGVPGDGLPPVVEHLTSVAGQGTPLDLMLELSSLLHEVDQVPVGVAVSTATPAAAQPDPSRPGTVQPPLPGGADPMASGRAPSHPAASGRAPSHPATSGGQASAPATGDGPPESPDDETLPELDSRWLVGTVIDHESPATTVCLAVLEHLLHDEVLRARVRRELRLRVDQVPAWAARLDDLVRLRGVREGIARIELRLPEDEELMGILHARLDDAGRPVGAVITPGSPAADWPHCAPLVRWGVEVAGAATEH